MKPPAAALCAILLWATSPCILSAQGAPVLTGLDVLERDGFASLRGAKVGLITNHTGLNRRGVSAIDLFASAEGVELVALFSPEHGLQGVLDRKVGDATHEATGLHVYSLYGDTRKPSPESLHGIDTLVFDIQDIGCRFYTYISTMGLALEAAGEQDVRFVVLDRPNPLGGVEVAGPVRDAGEDSFVAFHAIPVCHGMTVGELARMFNAERKVGAQLEIIRAENWRRGDPWDATGLYWTNPSPNMRSSTQALLYPGVGLLEFTNLSVGRGTDTPFEIFGAPWLDAGQLAATLNARELPGARFVPFRFTPASSVFRGESCEGVRIVVTQRDALRPLALGMHLATALRAQHEADWDTARYDRLLRHRASLDALRDGRSAEEIQELWQPGLAAFRKRRAKYLLY